MMFQHQELFGFAYLKQTSLKIFFKVSWVTTTGGKIKTEFCFFPARLR